MPFNPVELARAAVTAFIKNGEIVTLPEHIPPEFERPGGAFVSIKISGRLRGCVGTFKPSRASVAEEIIQNAVGSAGRDPRFTPISEDELPFLEFSVDVLDEPERLTASPELDPMIYGLIVRAGSKVGLLLPDLEGIRTPEAQIRVAMQKAGILHHEDVEFYRFKSTRYFDDKSIPPEAPGGA